MIGDPSGKNATRPPLSPDEIKENAKTYETRITSYNVCYTKLLRAEIPPAEICVDARTLALKFDPEWLSVNPLTLADLAREQRLLAQAGYELRYG